MSNKITKNELHADIVQKLDDGATKQELQGIENKLTAHASEDTIYLASGTANAITVTTPQGNYSYGQFKQLHFKAGTTNTGNLTINVDGKGTIPALKFDGTQLAAGAIKAGKIYDWYYDTASGGRFFLIAKASGTAVVGDVLAGKPFSNDDGEFVGAMPNRGNVGAQKLTTQNQTYIIPSGYHDGSGSVQATYVAGVPGGKRYASGVTGYMTNQSSQMISLGFVPSVIFVYLNQSHHSNSMAVYDPYNNAMHIQKNGYGVLYIEPEIKNAGGTTFTIFAYGSSNSDFESSGSVVHWYAIER